MEKKPFQLILNNKFFQIPVKFNHLNDIPPSILNTLVTDPNHRYYVKSDVTEEVFQNFIDYLVEDQIPDIQEDDFYLYYELCEEFNLMDLIYQKKPGINQYLINIKGLQYSKKNYLPKIEEEISQHLDEYLDQEGELLMNAPIQSLYNIFNHCNRHLKNHDVAYELIKRQFENNHDPKIFILIESLDGSKLSQKNLEESLSLKNLHYNYEPHVEYRKIFLTNRIYENREISGKSMKKSNNFANIYNIAFIIMFFALLIIVFKQRNEIIKINQNYSKLILNQDSLLQKIQSNKKINDETVEKQSVISVDVENLKSGISNLSNNMVLLNEKTLSNFNENLLKVLYIFNDESFHFKFDFFIPTGKSWIRKSPTEFILFDNNKNYTVISSSTWGNDQSHTPNHLFRGKKEINGHIVWASNKSPSSPQFILISFSDSVDANILSMTSRDYWYDESPNNFKILAGNNTDDLKILKNYSYVEWFKNCKKNFYFKNENSYKFYKIEFTSSKNSDFIYGLAELNLGKVNY